MTMNEAAASITSLWRFPVKSMLGEEVELAELTGNGIAGDRAYAVIDAETGKVVSAKSTKTFPGILGCRASFMGTPETGAPAPPVRITLADGTMVMSDDSGADAALSRFFGRDVRLASAAPDDFTIDQYHPDVEGADPAGHRDTVVEQKLGTAFFAEAGMPSPVAAGSFFDLFPVSVMTTSTLAQFSELRPESRFDARRFRMNVMVATGEKGFVENSWVGRAVSLGGEARVRVVLPDPRCVMTTLAQDDLPKDTEVLRTLSRHNRLEIPGAGPYPCAGVYAVVESAGTLRRGDPVAVD